MMSDPCPYCYPVEHVNQACKSVYKHEHMGYPPGEYPCDKPWTALCQTAHGDICYASDHRHQSEAVSALGEHLRRAECINPGDGDRPPAETCRVVRQAVA